MKKLMLTFLAAAAVFSARAQWPTPEAFGGALWGTLLGGIIGADCHHGFSGEGAAIGAGIGLLAGSIVGEARRQEYRADYYYAGGAPACPPYSPYAYYAPNAYCAPGYYYQPARPNYAIGGTLLGAASGALIGAGNHQAGPGAAIGAAAGLVVGSVAEATTRHREQQYAMAPPPPPPPAPAAPPVPRPLPPHRSHAAPPPAPPAPVVAASSFAPRIPDAPRVPDAPTF